MRVTYYGHSCFSILAGSQELLFDPYISPNPLAKNIDIDGITADYVFASHAHFDHITDLLRIAKNTGAKAVGGWELYNWFNSNGLSNTFPINPGGESEFGFGKVKCFAAVHSSSFEDGSYGGVPCGYAFATSAGNFYYSGDTALTLDMELVSKWNKMDFAVMPIGDVLTMGVKDAIAACQMIGVKKMIGVHYDTFGFIKLDHKKAINDFREANLELILMGIGESLDL
ncbi:metal-dependent hydrolase [Pedobacter jamesrossensis]|uniref:Metal-dependent hydrolase n=1 Tax=Pedobacter jamesrossensis TaxID=1908238 RepID=A0ABV8NL44_9SPHI